MKKWVKVTSISKCSISIFSSVIFIICLLFYWYEIRPAQIRHDCSWVQQHVDKIPARSAMTVNELRSKGIIKNCKMNFNIPTPSSKGAATDLLYKMQAGVYCQEENKRIIEDYNRAKPEVPAKTWWEKSTEEEYRFCLRDKGL